MGFSLILRAFFSFPNERQFIECQFFLEFRNRGAWVVLWDGGLSVSRASRKSKTARPQRV